MERNPNKLPTADPPPGGGGIRMRVGVGAGVVLVLVAAVVAVVISAASAHPASASAGADGYSSTNSSYSSDPASTDAPSVGLDTTESVGASSGSSIAFVQVVGQVQKPGLYELRAGDRIVDAVAAAGGFTPKADQASLNLAQVIADGQQIVVAVKGAAPAAAGAAQGAGGSAATSTVDINTADATGLETLDGIGPALAQRILAYRTAHGGFRSVNDLQNVTGIGPKKFAAIKGSVTT
jgi:competence protein ComEA